MTTQQIETFVKDTQSITQELLNRSPKWYLSIGTGSPEGHMAIVIRRADVLIPEKGIPKHDPEVSDGYPRNYYRSDFDDVVKAREYLEHAIVAFVK